MVKNVFLINPWLTALDISFAYCALKYCELIDAETSHPPVITRLNRGTGTTDSAVTLKMFADAIKHRVYTSSVYE